MENLISFKSIGMNTAMLEAIDVPYFQSISQNDVPIVFEESQIAKSNNIAKALILTSIGIIIFVITHNIVENQKKEVEVNKKNSRQYF